MAQTEDNIGVALSPAAIRVVRMDRRARRVTAFAHAPLGYDDWERMREHAQECGAALARCFDDAGVRGGGCITTLPYSRGRAAVVTLPWMKAREIGRVAAGAQLWRKHFGVTAGTHDLAWRVVARDAAARRVSMLLMATPREEVAFCRELFDAVRATGARLRIIGPACLDYYYAARAGGAARRFLVLDECDAYAASFAARTFDVRPLEIGVADRLRILDEHADEAALEPALHRLAAELRAHVARAPQAGTTGTTDVAADADAAPALEFASTLSAKALAARLELLRPLVPGVRLAAVAVGADAQLDHSFSRALALARWRRDAASQGRSSQARLIGAAHPKPTGFLVREAPNYRAAAGYWIVSMTLALALAAWQQELHSQSLALGAHAERHALLHAEHRRHAAAAAAAARRFARWNGMRAAAEALFERQNHIPRLLESVSLALGDGLRLERLDCVSPRRCRLIGSAPSYEGIAAFAERLQNTEGVHEVMIDGVSAEGANGARRFEIECTLDETAEAA